MAGTVNTSRAASRAAFFTLITAALVLPLCAFSATAPPAATPELHAADRDGDGSIGEATAIRRRIEAYHRMHGIDGEVTAAQMLERARFTYQRHLEERRDFYSKGIEGQGWISLGPTNGAGRAPAVAPHPTDPDTLLVGAAGGGLWRSIDGGASWTPLTDGISDLSVGAVAYAPGNPEVIYLGSGEGGYAADFIPGIGLLRSIDGGETWHLPNTAEDILATQFFALNVYHGPAGDLNDPATYTVLAATNRGLFRSFDGGTTWETVIPGNGLVGVTEILRPDPDGNPELLFAAPWCSTTCPDGIGRVMRSTDAGTTWTPVADGLPDPIANSSRNRNALTSTRDGRTLYVGLNTAANVGNSPAGQVWRSDDSGDTWLKMTDSTYLGAQGWYDNTITVHPTNPDIVVAGGVWYITSTNGGSTWTNRNPYNSPGGGMGTGTLPHVDAHDLQWQGETLWVGCDGGVWRSEDYGATWESRNDGLVTRQYYGMAVDPVHPARVIGGTQDNETNLRNLADDGTWQQVIGGDGFECAINSLVSDIMYGSIYDTAIYRNTKGGSGSWESITPILNENEQTPFITPITMRFEKPWEIYTGTDRVWKTPDGGDTWVVLPTEVENGAWGSSTVGAIALTPADEDVLMVAKGNLVYSTHNGGETWRMSALGSALNVAISPHDANQAVACMASSASGITGIWRTLDGGVTWSPSGYGLPSFAVQVAAWDPTDPAVVFAGTDVGLYRSVDGGVNWQRFGQGLPAASVHDLRILPDGSMLKVATHGRGMWELVLDTVENQSPTIEITSHATNFTGNALGIVDLSASASDPDGDPLELSWIVADEWQITDGGSGVGTVESNVSIPLTGAGQYLIAAYVKDDKGGAAFDTISGLVFEPANDCAAPRVIPGAGPFPVALATNNFTSVRAESDPDVPCIDDPDFPNAGAESTIWFEFTPVASGTYEVATCGSASDTVLTAWTGDACGPYTLVANGCNDDDEQVHCLGQRTDSYLELELEAGTTYRFMVGAYITQSTGKFRLQVNCEDCTPTVEEPEFRAIVPAVANAAGDAGTSWLTDLNIYNPGKQDAEVTLEYRATGAGSGGFLYGMDSRLAPESAAEFSNVLGETLETEGSGALLIESDHELIIASRTYNTSPDGTFGQFIPGVPSTRAVAPGDSARLIGLAENDSFRSNLGLANASAEEASVTIELYGADGTLLASRDESLAAFGSTQINRILDKENLDGQASVTALVHNTSEQASIVAYVSTVDATTGDPIYAGAADEATPHVPLWIAASAHADGAGTSVWRTDLELANTSDLPVQVTVEFFGPAPMTERPFAIVDLAASEAMMLPDVLSPMMESGAGALRISVNDGSLAVSSRTYNQTDNGTYGQYVPGQSESDAVTAGQRAVLTQLRQAENQFRTNVGVVNVSESPITVDALFFDVEGSYLGFRQFNLEPLEYEQKNGAVPAEGINGGFAILSSDSPGAAFLAYASVIDSGSDDPVFIPAVALSE